MTGFASREARAAFIAGLPKAELHLHIEGSLEPEMMFSLAQRNGVSLVFESVEAIRAAYDFSNLQDFLDIYYQGANVLQTEDDFRELALAYFTRLHADAGVHAEGQVASVRLANELAAPVLARALALAPNGDLLMGGDFDNVAGVYTGRIARWSHDIRRIRFF